MIRRYDLLSELGRSSTGAVYVAADRLTGTQVALRRVTAPVVAPGAIPDRRSRERPDDPRPADTHAEDESAGRVDLSRQLQLIASLRHPKIAGVIDYGFDEEMRPFYTTRWIEQPRELLAAGYDRSRDGRLDLLLQTLQGLVYLHRHGVVHGDLRSRTALVDGDDVRLVNYGLSALREVETDADAVYLPPEVARGAPVSRQGDLFAVGVLARSLLTRSFTGECRVPARPSDEPAISTRDFDAPAIPVLERLLAPDPRERYADAAEVVHDLCAAFDRSDPVETAEIRESFLQAARFAGRAGEMRQLEERLDRAGEGQGGVVVVAGESGVGKSRLLEELRLVALARGALVLRGRAVAEALSPYRCWRQVLRHLCLWVEVDDPEAAVLSAQWTGIDELLEREVAAAPMLDPMAARQRFEKVVGELFGRLAQPTVVLLEDLHWAGSESIALLLELRCVAERQPLLIVGTFRDDERPDLAVELAELTQLKLERLGLGAVAELTESIVGPAVAQPALTDFLHRETGGNAFFVVEVVRALAEDAGRLDRIDPEQLPEQVTTGGIRRVLERRLDRLPRRVKPLLRLAAVAGREIDLELLNVLEPGLRPTLWLRFCLDQAVVETVDGRWRFTSDRFRDALTCGLSAADLRAAHRRVAEAYAAAYPRDPERAATLAHHWSRAADLSDPEATRQAVVHLERAGGQALASCAFGEAERALLQARELLGTLPAGDHRLEIRVQVGLGGVYSISKGFAFPEVAQAFGRARALCGETAQTTELMPALLGLWRFRLIRAELDRARELAEEMVRHARSRRRPAIRMLAEYALGSTVLFQGEPEAASRRLTAAVDIHSRLRTGPRRQIAAAAFYLGQHPAVASLDYAGWAMWLRGYPEHAVALNDRALALSEELAHPFSQAYAWLMRAWSDHLRNDPEAAAGSAAKAEDLSRRGGFPNLEVVASVFKGWARARLGDAESGIGIIGSALAQLRAGGAELFRPTFLALLADAHGAAAQARQGIECLEEAIEDAVTCGSGYWEPELHRQLGELCLRLPRPDRSRAEASFQQAVKVARRCRARSLELRALTSWALLEQENGRSAASVLASLGDVYRSFSEGLETPDLVAARRLL